MRKKKNVHTKFHENMSTDSEFERRRHTKHDDLRGLIFFNVMKKNWPTKCLVHLTLIL
jgi:hypothetical protein